MTTPPKSRRDHRVDPCIGKQCRQACPNFSANRGILQHQRALDIGAAVAPAGQLKMPVPDGSRGFKQLQKFFAREHSCLLCARETNRFGYLNVETSGD